MTSSLLYDTFRQPAGYTGRLAGWLMSLRNRERSDWTVEQLHIQPYQRILEVGYGPGNTLEKVARRLQTGYLAGIDHSAAMYRQAFKRNRSFISRQLVQLHMGDLSELSYPSHYFHTIYGSNVHFFWRDPQAEYIRLSNLLDNGGKLVMVFQPLRARNDGEVRQMSSIVAGDFDQAGLTRVSVQYKDMNPVPCIAVTGFRP